MLLAPIQFLVTKGFCKSFSKPVGVNWNYLPTTNLGLVNPLQGTAAFLLTAQHTDLVNQPIKVSYVHDEVRI